MKSIRLKSNLSCRQLAIIICLAFAVRGTPLAAQSPIIEPVLPRISETTLKGEQRIVPADELYELEIDLYQCFQRTDAPDELFACHRFVLGGGSSRLTEVIIRGEEAELRLYPDNCRFRYFHRKLSSEELTLLRKFMADKAIDRLRKYDVGTYDGVEYTYTHLTKKDGRRLEINNPPDEYELRELAANAPERVYSDLVALFESLADSERLQVKYLSTYVSNDVEVLFAHPEHEIRMVWAKGDDIRLLVGKHSMWPQEWRSLCNGKLGTPVECPEGFPPTIKSDSNLYGKIDAFGLEYAYDKCQPWQATLGNKYIRGGKDEDDTPGTWICENGKKPERLFDKPISHQLVSPDGRWLMGVLEGKLICYDLENNRTIRIESQKSVDSLLPLHYLPVQKQFLLICPGRQEARLPLLPPDYPWFPATYYLFDPVSGNVVEVQYSGNIDALRQPMRHPMQPAERSGVVWLAYGSSKKQGIIGRFDTNKLGFLNWMTIDTFHFDNDHFWVDASSKKLYIIYRGHLLRLPLSDEIYENQFVETPMLGEQN